MWGSAPLARGPRRPLFAYGLSFFSQSMSDGRPAGTRSLTVCGPWSATSTPSGNWLGPSPCTDRTSPSDLRFEVVLPPGYSSNIWNCRAGASSLDLPNMLERLSVSAPSAPDGVFATSMFGTGVDVDRLGLMVVHGQPKTTASYIQATGRVGRASGGLVVTFFRASRPRDLDHYEFFTGYHHALYRYVEPITVAPFSPRARERALGPLSVVLLRHASEIGGHAVDSDWRVQQRISGGYHSEAGRMSAHRHDPEVEAIPDVMENRAIRQPAGRRPAQGSTASETRSELDRWAALAGLHQGPDHFVYDESTANSPPQRHVVLGDAQHRQQGFAEAYENTPQSLREVEETTGFQT